MFEQVKDYKSACKVLGIKPIDTCTAVYTAMYYYSSN